MRFRSLSGAIAAVGLAIFWVAALSVSGLALDQRFTDTDGDMVADTPTDSKAVIDPPVLIFSYTPVEDPAMYAKVWDSFIKHLEKTTGKRVQFFPVQSNAAQLEAMRAGRLHVAGFNSGAVPLAVNCAGFVPFTLMASKDGQYGYEMEIITFPGSGVTKIEDIKGKKMAFTAQTSNSGFRAPSALLKQTYGLEAGKDYEPVFSGKHDNSVIGVANKDYPAAAIANEVMFRIIERGVVKKDQIITIYKSKTYPTTGYGLVYNLKPELAAKVKEAFFTFPWDGSELQKEFASTTPPMQKFLPINYKEHWQSVRESDEAVGVKYDCKG
ncbi:MAG: phosphate/phosphite/phosphonate ABC transporter substrate-binding protein [Pseudorhodoplanes sp.]